MFKHKKWGACMNETRVSMDECLLSRSYFSSPSFPVRTTPQAFPALRRQKGQRMSFYLQAKRIGSFCYLLCAIERPVAQVRFSNLLSNQDALM